MKIVIDTYAWIEIFIGSKWEKSKGDPSKSEEAYKPDIVIAEIARKYLREVKEKVILECLTTIEEISEIIPIDKTSLLNLQNAI